MTIALSITGTAVSVLVFGVAFRAAVSFANKVLGRGASSATGETPSVGKTAIPEPSFEKAFGLAILMALLIGGINYGLKMWMGEIFGEGQRPPVVRLSIVGGFLAVVFFKWILPTTWLRALLVWVLHVSICMVLGLIIGLAVYLASLI